MLFPEFLWSGVRGPVDFWEVVDTTPAFLIETPAYMYPGVDYFGPVDNSDNVSGRSFHSTATEIRGADNSPGELILISVSVFFLLEGF
jgi:hypothetical protein